MVPRPLNLEPRWSQDLQLGAKMVPRPSTWSQDGTKISQHGFQTLILEATSRTPASNHHSPITNPQSSTFNLPQGGGWRQGRSPLILRRTPEVRPAVSERAGLCQRSLSMIYLGGTAPAAHPTHMSFPFLIVIIISLVIKEDRLTRKSNSNI